LIRKRGAPGVTIALRASSGKTNACLLLARISHGGAKADAECRRMASEKFAAAAAARAAGAAALAAGKGIDTALALALAPVMRTVRANHRRLSQAERIDGVILGMRRLLPSNFRGHRR